MVHVNVVERLKHAITQCFFSCNAEKVDQNTEAKLVVQALRINTMSKLTFSDSMRFDALLRDVFPGAYYYNFF